MSGEQPNPRTEFDHAELDATERLFWADVWDAPSPAVASGHGVESRDFGPVRAMAVADLPEVPMLNLVLGAAEPGAVSGGHLAAAIEWIDSLGVAYYVPVTPGEPATAEAEAWLSAAGFGKGYGWMKFVRDTSPPEPDDRPLAPVTELGAGEGGRFGEIVAAGFGLPAWTSDLFRDLPGREGWRCYVAEVDGTAQAAAAMRAHRGVAELGFAATLPPARGHGCQTALLRRRIADAAVAGCRLLFVETGERAPDRPDPSYRNILRAGFEEAYLRPNWRR